MLWVTVWVWCVYWYGCVGVFASSNMSFEFPGFATLTFATCATKREKERPSVGKREWERERANSPGESLICIVCCFGSASTSAMLPVYNQHMFGPNWLQSERGEAFKRQGDSSIAECYVGLCVVCCVVVSCRDTAIKSVEQREGKRDIKWGKETFSRVGCVCVWESKAELSAAKSKIKSKKRWIFYKKKSSVALNLLKCYFSERKKIYLCWLENLKDSLTKQRNI